MSEPEILGLDEWMEQVNKAVGDFNGLIAEHSGRLAELDGQNFALRCLLHTFIKREIVPEAAATVLVREMIGKINEQSRANLYEEALFKSAKGLLESLIAEGQPPKPRFTVIDGGKAGKQD